MSVTSSDNEAAMLVPEIKADILSPPLKGGRNARSAKRKLSFDGASSKIVDCSLPRSDCTPSPFRATCPVNLHFSLSFMVRSGKRHAVPLVSLLTGRSSQQFGHQPHESKNKFVEPMAIDGRTILHAEPRHAPASPFSLISGAGVESFKGSANTLEDEFEFLDWYHAPDPVWWVSLLPLPNNVEDRVGRNWFLPVIHQESKLTQEHMDVILHLLVQNFEPHEAPPVRNWTFLDFKCWPHYDDYREILNPYVWWHQPTMSSLAWKDAERIFGVGDLSSNHWILYEICKIEKLVRVYDPMSNEVSPSHVKDTFFSMSYHLSDLFEEAGIKFGFPRAHRWRVVNVKSPQQARYCDGGFMVLEYLKCLVKGASVLIHPTATCTASLLRILVQIWDGVVGEICLRRRHWRLLLISLHYP
ncbi:hypothetical protein C2S53_012005 [Perilla frutescens var. hirtella]|uniref:Ubiquitin-like protease family profile domain-containing protein n=1 Tax=Perilla frutescens var. hirtella TaxID=608512 RepID=A0AAD4IZ00_PERFH|nr:hypothetical protein C2S53_012005 [Perilla frutescens var. hirtella]